MFETLAKYLNSMPLYALLELAAFDNIDINCNDGKISEVICHE